MADHHVHLHYSYQTDAAQASAGLQHPLFELLAALRQGGSIQHAATALGASYRHVWGALKQWEERLGEPLVSWVQGQPARLTPFAERLHWQEARTRARLAPQIDAVRAELEWALADALEGPLPRLGCAASPAPLWALLREQASQARAVRLSLQATGSLHALRELAEGHCQLAAFHWPSNEALAPPLPTGLAPRWMTAAGDSEKAASAITTGAAAAGSRPSSAAAKSTATTRLGSAAPMAIKIARRHFGLLLAPRNPRQVQTLADLAQPGLRLAQRQAGSASSALGEHLLREAGLSGLISPAALPATDPEAEHSDTALAATIASGAADAGFGSEAAALAQGLAFVPLLEEHCWLACHEQAQQLPAWAALQDCLESRAWRQQLAALPGYMAC